jgi:hypothetical protein
MRLITITEEPMDESEIAFLIRRRNEQIPLLKRTIRVFAAFWVAIPIVVGIALSIFNAIARDRVNPPDEPPPNIFMLCLVGALGLLVVIGFATWFSYTRTILPLTKDIRRRLKIVEKSEIVRKHFMRENNSYHFYISSPTRLSIEVQAEDFVAYDVGDEINIEYTRSAKIYLGYY